MDTKIEETIEEMMPLAHRIGRKFGEDGVAVAYEALTMAVNKLAIKAHPEPVKYTSKTIKGRVRRYLEYTPLVRKPRSAYKREGGGGCEQLPIEAISESLIYGQRPDHMLWQDLCEYLHRDELLIIEMRLNGDDDEAIGKYFGVSRQAIQQRRQRLAEKVRMLLK